MIFLNGNRMILVVVGVVAVIVLIGGNAKADFIFGELTNLGSPVNSSSADVFGCLSADGLEIYIERADKSTGWHYDIWVAKRPTIDDEWGTPVRLGSNVNTPGLNNQEASISADGLELYFSRGGESTDNDLYVTTRETTAQEWLPAVSLGDVVNSSALEDGASISADGLSLYFVSNRDGGEGGKDLYVTRRESTNHAWDIPVNLGPNINSPEQDSAPSISSDNLTLIFRSNRPGKYSSEDYPDLWLTTRRTTSDSWREPINLGPEINTDDVDLATISPDRQTLYLTCYRRSGGIGWYDIWKAPIEPIVDLNADGIVDAADMCILVDNWGTDNKLCDVGPMPWGDGVVDVQDLIVLAEHLFEEFPPINEPTEEIEALAQ